MKRLRSAVLVVVMLAVTARARAQGVTLRTGLTYNPNDTPAIAIVPVKGGPYADSIGSIVQRDLQYSDRVAILQLNPADVGVFYDAFKGISYDFFTGLGAKVVVEMTATQTRLNVKVHEVTRHQAMATVDFALPATALGREWRLAVHTASDSVQAIITNVRGVAATRIAYVRGQTLHVIDSDGAFDIQVPADSNALSPAWNPTGDHLVYATFGVGSRIIATNLANGQSNVLQKEIRNTQLTTPIYAPDGNSVVYARSDDDGWSTLWRIPLAGGYPMPGAGPQLIERGKGISGSPSFSPDGRRIAFTTDRLGHNEVYIIDSDGTNAQWITQIAGDLNEESYRAEPDWSPDGVTVAFQSRVSGRFQIMTVNLRDNSSKLLTDAGENESPSWAADGRHIVFTSSRSGSGQLWIMDTQSGVTRQLTNASGARYGAWSPRLTYRP
jgi:TolB protein